jgi:hypothetical protein
MHRILPEYLERKDANAILVSRIETACFCGRRDYDEDAAHRSMLRSGDVSVTLAEHPISTDCRQPAANWKLCSNGVCDQSDESSRDPRLIGRSKCYEAS